MNGTGSTLPPPVGGNVREFAVRFTGDRDRLRLDFNKQAQEAFGLAYGDQVVVTANDQGQLIITRVDGEKFGDPARSGKIAALRAAQRAHGLREVANWNLVLKTRLRRELGTSVGAVVVPAELAEDFAWWERKKMARERKLIPKRIAAAALGSDVVASGAGADRARPEGLKAKR